MENDSLSLNMWFLSQTAQHKSNQCTLLPFCPMNLSVDLRYRMLVLLSLGLLGLFRVCLSTLEKATFRCWSTVFRWKYLRRNRVFSQWYVAAEGWYREIISMPFVDFLADMWVGNDLFKIKGTWVLNMLVLCCCLDEKIMICSYVQKYIMTILCTALEILFSCDDRRNCHMWEHCETHFVLKNIRVVSSVEGEWAPSCLHSHSISSVTWLGIM